MKLGSATLISNVVNVVGLFIINTALVYGTTKLFRSAWGLLVGAIIAAAISSQGYVLFWTFSGMETTLYLAIFTLFIGIPLTAGESMASWTTLRKTTFVIVALLLGTFRLEAGLIVCVTIATWVALDRQLWKTSKKTAWTILTAGFAGLVLLFTFWLTYYGHLTPEPIRYKQIAVPYAIGLKGSLGLALGFIAQHLALVALGVLSLVVIGLQTLKSRRLSSKNVFLIATLIAPSIFLLASPSSDSFRYHLLLLPPLGWAVAYSSALVFDLWLTRTRKIKVTSLAAVILLLIIPIFVQAKISIQTVMSANQWWFYIQEARITAGKWMEENSPAGSRVLSGDLGAIAFYNLSNVYLDSGGLTSKFLLDSIENGGSYPNAIVKQYPEFVVDTEESGLTGSERIFNESNVFYNSGVYSNCRFSDVFVKQNLKRIPKNPEDGELAVGIYKLSPIANQECLS